MAAILAQRMGDTRRAAMGTVGHDTNLDRRAEMDFVLRLRRRWSQDLYAALQDQYEESVDCSNAEAPVNGHEAMTVVDSLPLAPWFNWMERAQQKMMWRSVQDAVVDDWARFESVMSNLPEEIVGVLELDPHLSLPKYYTAFDIHLQPGGVWTNEMSAFVYEEGAQIVMLRENDEYLFHTLMVETALPSPEDVGRITRVVDLGCGFGKSTRPLVDAYPSAEIIGLDLSGPVLRLAHATAERMGKRIRFRQADAADSGLASGSADIVTGTMVLHEMPMKHVQAVLNESARLLKPGGVIRFLEFSQTGDPFRDASMYGHGERNNEPWISALMDADVAGMCENAGLDPGMWTPFDEKGRGLSAQGWDERSDWHFPWSVLSARKPEGASR